MRINAATCSSIILIKIFITTMDEGKYNISCLHVTFMRSSFALPNISQLNECCIKQTKVHWTWRSIGWQFASKNFIKNFDVTNCLPSSTVDNNFCLKNLTLECEWNEDSHTKLKINQRKLLLHLVRLFAQSLFL